MLFNLRSRQNKQSAEIVTTVTAVIKHADQGAIMDASTQTDPRNLRDRPTQTGEMTDSDDTELPGACHVSCQTNSGGPVQELGIQTEHVPHVDAATEMERKETSEAEAQVRRMRLMIYAALI